MTQLVPQWVARMDSTERFQAYMRVSLHVSVAFLAVVLIVPALWEPQPLWLTVAVLVVTAANLVLVLWSVEELPGISREPSGRWPQLRRWGFAAGVATLVVYAGLTWLVEVESPVMLASGLVSVFCLAMIYTPTLRFGLWITVALGLVGGYLFQLSTFAVPLAIAAFTVVLWAAGKITLWSVQVVNELDRSRDLESQVRVNQERLRFAQELHDSLGQHLAAMSLKTQLALSLYKRGDGQVEEELRDLEGLIRLTRKDLNQVVSGYREVSVEDEIVSAGKVLRAAGVEVRVSGDATQVPPHVQETAAWFIRESATNVLKHSRATWTEISVGAAQVRVVNDGAPENIGKLGGTRPLQQRALEFDGSIELRNRDGEFAAVMTWQ